MTLRDLLLLPWTWSDPTFVPDPDGAYWELRIRELPDFFVAAAGRDEVVEEAPRALAAFLQSYLDHGQVPPLPNPGRGQWVYALNGAPVGAEVHGGNWVALGSHQREPQTA
jgi:hypothetical protein